MIISGSQLAEKRLLKLKSEAKEVEAKLGRLPKLTVILVGEDPASKVYVGHKEKACAKVGIESELIKMPADTSKQALLSEIKRLNDDVGTDGVLVQLPLPEHLKSFDPTDHIAAFKDVDGLTSENMGLMLKAKAWSEPCTPKGVIFLLKEAGVLLEGKKAVVVGRSHIVGWPMAWMLTRENATVTVCHSKTQDLSKHLKEADIVVAAAGIPQFLNKDHFKENAVVVDVGIHRLNGKLVGDVLTEGFNEKNISFTPVPGGVGPMTVSVLLENVLELASKKG